MGVDGDYDDGGADEDDKDKDDEDKDGDDGGGDDFDDDDDDADRVASRQYYRKLLALSRGRRFLIFASNR